MWDLIESVPDHCFIFLLCVKLACKMINAMINYFMSRYAFWCSFIWENYSKISLL